MRNALTFIMLLAFCVASAAQSEYSRNGLLEKTLRIDYTFTGTDRTSDIAVAELCSIDGWAGRRVNMDKVLLRGNAQICMRDAESGKVLYRQSFSTLFQEWQTSEEAAGVRKSFEHVAMLPMPSSRVSVTVELYDVHDKVAASLTHEVDPKDILMRPVGKDVPEHKYVLKSGSPEECIDIVIVAEGYTAAEKDLFYADASRTVEAMLSHEPYASMKDRFNFVAVALESAESGVSIPHQGLWKDTAVGSSFDTFYSDRYLTTLRIKSLYDQICGVPFEHIVILANTDNYGGGGIFNSYVMASAHHKTFIPVVVHEFGHSFGGLADEYYYDDQYVDYYYPDVEPWEPNITTKFNFDSKWKDMLGTKGKDGRTVGLYEGGGYMSKGVWRPYPDCRMQTNSNPDFCPVCERAVRDMIDFYTMPQPANTNRIDANDSPEEIIAKAVATVPSPRQKAAMDREFIAFVHFGPNTFTGMEWGTGTENPAVFNPAGLDTDQWCRTLKDAGMKMVILTVKHHDGFVLWQSRYTDHGIMSSPYKGGQGDVLRELSESCRKYGLKLGIYLSPADLHQMEDGGLYGNGSEATLRTIPREVEGRPFADKRKFSFVLDDYNEYYLNQLFELLTEYGPVDEVWLDGAHPKRKGGQQYDYTAWRELIRTLVPDAAVFGREDLRWCGNEAGETRDQEWNVIAYAENPDSMRVYHDITDPVLGTRDVLLAQEKPFYLHYQPAETDTSIRDGWFWRNDDEQYVRTADEVFDIYERTVGGNSILLLNIPPNREGRFSERDVQTLEETGRRIRDTYGTDLSEGADLQIDGRTSILKMPGRVTFNRIVLTEPVYRTGERVESFAVDIWKGGRWKEIHRGNNIGRKRIVRLDKVTSDRLRIRITDSRDEPVLGPISLHLNER